MARVWATCVAEINQTGVDERGLGGRELMEDLGGVVGAVLLVEDACRDEDAIAEKVARRWILRKEHFIGTVKEKEWMSKAVWERKIVFGNRPLTKL